MTRSKVVYKRCESLHETIRLADDISSGKVEIRRLNNGACLEAGEQLANAAGILVLCHEQACRESQPYAHVGMYERFAGYYRRIAEKALMTSGTFASKAAAAGHCDGIEASIRVEFSRYEVDAIDLFDAAMGLVERMDRQQCAGG
ncbi:MAG: hypothetical protein QNJ00_15050 [Woeseiaceae bacterium]|nr:hypothetical protein [Woeseiaceae bacterium]